MRAGDELLPDVDEISGVVAPGQEGGDPEAIEAEDDTTNQPGRRWQRGYAGDGRFPGLFLLLLLGDFMFA